MVVLKPSRQACTRPAPTSRNTWACVLPPSNTLSNVNAAAVRPRPATTDVGVPELRQDGDEEGRTRRYTSTSELPGELIAKRRRLVADDYFSFFFCLRPFLFFFFLY